MSKDPRLRPHGLKQRVVDQAVVNQGILPFDELYFKVRSQSRIEDAVHYDALIAGRSQEIACNLTRGASTVPDSRRGRGQQHPRAAFFTTLPWSRICASRVR